MNIYCIIILISIISSCSAFVYRDDNLLSNRNSRQTQMRLQSPAMKRIEQAYSKTNINEILSKNVLRIAKDLLKISPKTGKYQIFSPIGIVNVLSLLAIGSNGITQKELNNILGFNRIPEFNENPLKIHTKFGLLIENLNGNIAREIKNSQDMTKIDTPKIPLQYQNLKEYHIFQRKSTKNKLNNKDQDLLSSATVKPSSDHEIEIANGIFIQSGLELQSDYKNAIKSIYRHNSDIVLLDFENDADAARNYINNWGKRKTSGKIVNLIADGIESTTNMIITSALYFRSLWQTTFIESATEQRAFYPNGKHNKHVLVNMMATGGQFLYYDAVEYNCQFLGIPFKDNLSVMYIILPYDSSKEKLEKLQDLLTSDLMDNIISHRMRKEMILVNLPRLQLETSMNLKEVFSEMGIKSLFNYIESDLSGIIKQSSSSNSHLLHKDEEILSKNINAKSHNIEMNNKNRKLNGFRSNQPILFENNFESAKEMNLITYIKSLQNNRMPKVMQNSQINKSNYNWIENLKFKRNIQRTLGSKLVNVKENLSKKIFVDDIVHKVNLNINEGGVEGAAATISHMPRNDFEHEFIVDGPFLFLIRHENTKLPIFYGSVQDPSV